MKLNNITRKAIHILLYGRPKVGKTELAGELAEHGFRLKVFDFENGSLTLTQSISEAYQDTVDIYKIPDTKDFPIAIETALKVIKPGIHRICDIHGKVSDLKTGDCPLCKKNLNATYSVFDNTNLGEKDIVIFDSLTQLSNSAMSHIGINKDDLWKPEWEHYRSQGAMLDRFLSTIQNAPWNCICITHEAMIETIDGKDEKNSKSVMLSPTCGTREFSRNTAKYFDEVVYVEVSNLKHRAASSSTYNLNTVTGSRSRTKIEDQKPTKEDEHISLLPIFQNQGILSLAAKAEARLVQVKSQVTQPLGGVK